MKQISNHLAIALTALIVPGGLPIAFAIWAYRRRVRYGETLRIALQRIDNRQKTSKPTLRHGEQIGANSSGKWAKVVKASGARAE